MPANKLVDVFRVMLRTRRGIEPETAYIYAEFTGHPLGEVEEAIVEARNLGPFVGPLRGYSAEDLGPPFSP